MLTAEGRWELVGCYAPFVHATVGARVRSGVIPESLGVPISLAVGGYPHRKVGLVVDYTVLIARYPDDDGNVRGHSRLRVGGEGHLSRRFRAGLVIDQVLGTVDGVFAQLYLSRSL
jgi:hypothetical protein